MRGVAPQGGVECSVERRFTLEKRGVVLLAVAVPLLVTPQVLSSRRSVLKASVLSLDLASPITWPRCLIQSESAWT